MGHGTPDWWGSEPSETIFQTQDAGELAARLGSIDTFDRRGNVLFLDSFEDGLARWATDSGGTGASVVVSAAEARSGAYSIKLVGGSDGDRVAEIRYSGAIPVFSKMGLEASFRLVSGVETLDFEISVYDGTDWLRGVIRYDDVNNRLRYLDSLGAWVNIATGVDLFHGTKCFHTLKFVADLENEKYYYALLNETGYSLSGIGLWKAASAVTPVLYHYIDLISVSGSNGSAYIDDVIITQNEP